jgi:hypothetical protein
MKSLYLAAGVVLGLIAGFVLLALHCSTPSGLGYQPLFAAGQKRFPIVSNTFRADKTEDASSLFFSWEDHQAEQYTVNFSLPDVTVAAAEAEFGYVPKEMNAYIEEHTAATKIEMIQHLREYALKRITKSKYSHYFYIEDTAYERFNLKITAPQDEDAELLDKVKVEFRKIAKGLEKERTRYLPRLIKEEHKHRKAYLKSRGLRYEDNQVMVDYRQAVVNNRPRMQPLVDSLRSEIKGKNIRDFISLLLAFVQTMDYGTPPDKEGDKIVLGFWPPPKVLLNNLGDCDSKAAVFASIWHHFQRYPIMLVTIPNHLFIGIAVPSFRGENFSINGLKFTFCEVTGPALIPAGFITRYSRLHLESGKFRYEMIN